MEEPKDEEDPQPEEERKEVWTTENDSNGNEMNLSSEFFLLFKFYLTAHESLKNVSEIF